MVKSDLTRTLFSIFGALALSATFVLAAVGSAKAAVPSVSSIAAPTVF